MTPFRRTVHDGIMFTALAGACAAAMLFARVTAEAVIYVGTLVMR